MLTTILPPLPPYEGLHPIIVHYPIALLLIAPVFIVIAAMWKSQSRAMLFAALVLCVIGTAFAFLATNTGEATENLVDKVPSAKATLDRHEDLAELARNLFIGVTALLGLVTGVYWKIHDKAGRGVRVVGAVVLLAAWAAPALVLMNAAHLGGELVHIHGVRAPIDGTGSGAASNPAAPSSPGAPGEARTHPSSDDDRSSKVRT